MVAHRTKNDERKRNFSKNGFNTLLSQDWNLSGKNPNLLSTNTLNEIENRLILRVRWFKGRKYSKIKAAW